MSAARYSLTPRQRQIYLRLLARTRRYPVRLTLAVLFGMMFGGSVFGILGTARSSLVQIFGGSETRLNEAASQWVARWYEGGMAHDGFLTILLLAGLLLLVVLRGVGFFLSKYLIEWIAQHVIMRLRN